MILLIDMNLSPQWVAFLTSRGVESVHWTSVGDPRAEDRVIMAWAREHGQVVFTHDLDFSALMAATEATSPSVLQLRTQDVLPAAVGEEVVSVLRQHQGALERGAFITIDKVRARLRILPLVPRFGGRTQG